MNQEPPQILKKFSWLNRELNPVLECKWCLIYENSICNDLFRNFLESNDKKLEDKFKKCFRENKDLYQNRYDEYNEWEELEKEKIREWKEFLDLQDAIKKKMEKK